MVLALALAWSGCTTTPGASGPATAPGGSPEPPAVPTGGHGAPAVAESGDAVRVSTGGLGLVVSKANGSVTSLSLDGTELLGHGGRGYVDLHATSGAYTLGSDRSATTYDVRRGGDWVDVVVTHHATPAVPLTIAQHYLVRGGERGVSLFTSVHHDPKAAATDLGELRFVVRGDPQIFDQHSVEDDVSGPMPSPAALAKAPAVQDATFDLAGLQSGYPKRYYTKYDWSALAAHHTVHGFTGHGHGLWIAQGQKDTLTGGPTRYDLAVHAADTPVLLNMLVSNHYGAKTPAIGSAAFDRTYGPFYLYANAGGGLAQLRADATRYAGPAFDADLYARAGIAGYVPEAQRGTVAGRVAIEGEAAPSGAVAVLDADRTEFARAADGYQYWTDVAADGSFTLRHVRPGTYRLTVYRAGTFGAYVRDGVVVAAAATLSLPVATWNPPGHGRTAWQIGTFDGSAAEFRHGDEYRNYWGTWDYDRDFPNGVHYVVGTSRPDTDWNYTQWRTFQGHVEDDWDVQFDLPAVPAPGTATLTVALAATRDASLAVLVNGTAQRLDWAIPPEDSSSCAVRSGIACFALARQLTFATTWLHAGTNHLRFHLPQGQYVQYDALRLELP